MKFRFGLVALLALSSVLAQAATDRYLDAQYIRNGTTGTLTLPTTTDTLVGRATTDTLTNKSMSGASNTFTNIPNSATTAASANTASAIVARDGSGNFSAGTISAALTGNASTATALAANPTDCSASQFATGIDAGGNLTCASPAGLAIVTATKTADYTLTSSDDVIFAQATAGTLTLTLPAASSNNGKVFRIKRIDALGTLLVKVLAAGSDLIDAEGSLFMTQQYQAIELISKGGSVWYVF